MCRDYYTDYIRLLLTGLRCGPLLKGTNRHEQRVPRVDSERISTTELILKNRFTVFNNSHSYTSYTTIMDVR